MDKGEMPEARGGTRGGSALFRWDTIKNDRGYENYLGHSVQAPRGRWQQGRDLLWYSKDKDADKDTDIDEVKKAEQEALRKALGGAANANAVPVTRSKMGPPKASVEKQRLREEHELRKKERARIRAERARKNGRG